MTRAQDAIRNLFRVTMDHTGNLPPLPGIFPDYPAPIVGNSPKGRELAMIRWGMPTPPMFLEGKRTDPGVTNIRNTKSSHWRRWLGPESRCLVPFTSFAEPDNGTYGGRAPVWFALDDMRPLALLRRHMDAVDVRPKGPRGRGTDAFGFLTINPSTEIPAIHEKAMPIILTTPDEFDAWLTLPAPEALKLQRPLPDGALRIVAQGSKTDGDLPAPLVL